MCAKQSYSETIKSIAFEAAISLLVQGVVMKFLFLLFTSITVLWARGNPSLLSPEDQDLVDSLCSLAEQGVKRQEAQKTKEVERVLEMINSCLSSEQRAVAFASLMGESPANFRNSLDGILLDDDQRYRVLTELIKQDEKALERRVDGMTVFDILVIEHQFNHLEALLVALYAHDSFLPLETIETIQLLVEREKTSMTDKQRTSIEVSLGVHRQARINILNQSLILPSGPKLLRIFTIQCPMR